MPRNFSRILCLTASFLCVSYAERAHALGFELFGKGSASKNNLSNSEYVVSMSGAAGIGINLFPQLRLEGRFTMISQNRNHMAFTATTDDGAVPLELTDIRTRSLIYSVNIDFDILSDKSPVQPFLVAGAGYSVTDSIYRIGIQGSGTTVDGQDPQRTSLTGIAGGGIRIRIVRSLALELEGLAYVLNPQNPAPMVDWLGTAGIRIFI